MKHIPALNTLPSGAEVKVRSCVAIPNRTTDPEGFVDLQNACPACDTPHFISVTALREAGRISGALVDSAEVEKLTKEFEEAEEALWATIAELRAEVDHYREVEDARALVEAEEVAA